MTATSPTDSPVEGEEEIRVKAWLTEVSTPRPLISPPTFECLRKRFAIRCSLLAAMIIAMLLDYYRHGLQLETTSAFSTTIFATLAIPVLFFRAAASAIGLLNDKSKKNPKHYLILLLLPAACFIPSRLKIPTFTDGAAHNLRDLSISDQLVTAVAEELLKPRDDHWRLEYDREEEILTKYPFSRLGLKYVNLRFNESSLLFEFGSPIANRWGFSISGIKGKPPIIPKECSDLKSVSKEIIVFWGPPD